MFYDNKPIPYIYLINVEDMNEGQHFTVDNSYLNEVSFEFIKNRASKNGIILVSKDDGEETTFWCLKKSAKQKNKLSGEDIIMSILRNNPDGMKKSQLEKAAISSGVYSTWFKKSLLNCIKEGIISEEKTHGNVGRPSFFYKMILEE